MKGKIFLLVLAALSGMMMSGCTLWEDIDEKIDRCPQTDDTVEPLPWEPQPGGDDLSTGH